MSLDHEAPYFHDLGNAYLFLENQAWPSGVRCPLCGEKKRVHRYKGPRSEVGVHRCYVCAKIFTVKSGTVFARSRVPLHLWLQAIYLFAGTGGAMKIDELSDILGVTFKTAWLMTLSIRNVLSANGVSERAN